MKFIITTVIALLMLSSCSKDNMDEYEPFAFKAPDHFPEQHYLFDGNEPTRPRFELGKRLFFDTQLSSDNTVSCASCHAQVHGFADHNVAFSQGVMGRTGKRNAPSIANMAWSPYYMWDGGVNHLELFPVAPILTRTK